MIDWHDVARHEPIRRIAETIRRQLNIWVGFLNPSGLAAPIGSRQPVEKPLCEALMGRRDGQGSCHLSLRTWYADLRKGKHPSEGASLVSCHAMLQAMLVPVVAEGEVIGACYASGFVVADDGKLDEGVEQTIFQRGRELDLQRSVISDGTRELVIVTQRELRLIGDLLQTIADLTLEFVGQETVQRTLSRSADGPREYPDIIGDSPAMHRLFRLLDKIADSESTVLIQGEPGVGKELVARAIHFNSFRANEPFVVQNCSALNDSLLDSELFGHKKGAFTGAITDKQGLFELADQGTFFLDEIGDMSPMLQVKLLRVLQEGTFVPVGDTVVRKVDVRIIAATNRNLRQMVKDGEFRSDLFYRINVIAVDVPPLRDRREDIPALLDFFLDKKARTNNCPRPTLSSEAIQLLQAHDWPGNVRELENEVERLVVLAPEGGELPLELLSPRIQNVTPGAVPSPGGVVVPGSKLASTLPQALEALERYMLHEGLKKTGWNKTQTAKELGISRRNLIRKVKSYELDDLRPDEM